MVSVEDDDLAGLEDVSSDGEDDNYEADLTDGDTTSSGAQPGRRPNRKKSRGIFFCTSSTLMTIFYDCFFAYCAHCDKIFCSR